MSRRRRTPRPEGGTERDRGKREAGRDRGRSEAGRDRSKRESGSDRGLRSLVTTRPTQLPFTTAMRAREVAVPTAEDLARAADEITIVRRHYVPPTPFAPGRHTDGTAGKPVPKPGKGSSRKPRRTTGRQDGSTTGR